MAVTNGGKTGRNEADGKAASDWSEWVPLYPVRFERIDERLNECTTGRGPLENGVFAWKEWKRPVTFFHFPPLYFLMIWHG